MSYGYLKLEIQESVNKYTFNCYKLTQLEITEQVKEAVTWRKQKVFINKKLNFLIKFN